MPDAKTPTLETYVSLNIHVCLLVLHVLWSFLHINAVEVNLCFPKGLQIKTSGPEVIKIFMLNSAEHEISNALKYKNIKKFRVFSRLR